MRLEGLVSRSSRKGGTDRKQRRKTTNQNLLPQNREQREKVSVSPQWSCTGVNAIYCPLPRSLSTNQFNTGALSRFSTSELFFLSCPFCHFPGSFQVALWLMSFAFLGSTRNVVVMIPPTSSNKSDLPCPDWVFASGTNV